MKYKLIYFLYRDDNYPACVFTKAISVVLWQAFAIPYVAYSQKVTFSFSFCTYCINLCLLNLLTTLFFNLLLFLISLHSAPLITNCCCFICIALSLESANQLPDSFCVPVEIHSHLLLPPFTFTHASSASSLLPVLLSSIGLPLLWFSLLFCLVSGWKFTRSTSPSLHRYFPPAVYQFSLFLVFAAL